MFTKKYFPTLLFIIFLLFTLSLLYPLHFVADDWEHIDAYHRGLSYQFISKFIHRVPSLIILHQLLFPFFYKGYFVLGKFITWFFLIFSSWSAINLFFAEIKIQKIKWYSLALITFLLAFGPNNYEWNLWPTNLTLMPSVFFILFSLYLDKKKSTIYSKVFKFFSVIFGFYAYESLLVLYILLEVSHTFYVEREDDGDWIALKLTIIKTLREVLPVIIVCISSKVILQKIYPYPYVAKKGFKLHLFNQFISLSFLHDYYKTRWISSPFSLLPILIFIFDRLKRDTKIQKIKDLLLFTAFILGSSYYFMVMDYSSRRALGGQLYFIWGLILILCYDFYQKSEVKKPIRKVIVSFFIFGYLFHQGYIMDMKNHEKKQLISNAIEIKQSIESASSLPYTVPYELFHKDFRRGWNLAIPLQLRGYISHMISEEHMMKTTLKDIPLR